VCPTQGCRTGGQSETQRRGASKRITELATTPRPSRKPPQLLDQPQGVRPITEGPESKRNKTQSPTKKFKYGGEWWDFNIKLRLKSPWGTGKRGNSGGREQGKLLKEERRLRLVARKKIVWAMLSKRCKDHLRGRKGGVM